MVASVRKNTPPPNSPNRANQPGSGLGNSTVLIDQRVEEAEAQRKVHDVGGNLQQSQRLAQRKQHQANALCTPPAREVQRADMLGVPRPKRATRCPDHVDPAANDPVGTGGHGRSQHEKAAHQRHVPKRVARRSLPRPAHRVAHAVGGHAGRVPIAHLGPAAQELHESMLGNAIPKKQAGIHTTN